MNEQLVGAVAGLVGGGVYVAFHSWDRRRHAKSAAAGKLPLPVSPLAMIARWAFVALAALGVLKAAPAGKFWFAGMFAGVFTIYLIWDLGKGMTQKK
jgi:hypothetical protein